MVGKAKSQAKAPPLKKRTRAVLGRVRSKTAVAHRGPQVLNVSASRTNVSAPSAQSVVMTNGRPRISANGVHCLITHRELVGEFTSVATFAPVSIDLSPTNPMFKFLAPVAKNWEKYRYKSLSVEIVTQAATSISGSIDHAVDYDPLDVAPNSVTALVNYCGSITTPPWVSSRLDCLEKGLTPLRWTGPVPVAGADLKTYSPGIYYASTLHSITPYVVRLFVNYSIDLYIPQGSAVSGQTLNSILIAGAGSAAGYAVMPTTTPTGGLINPFSSWAAASVVADSGPGNLSIRGGGPGSPWDAYYIIWDGRNSIMSQIVARFTDPGSLRFFNALGVTVTDYNSNNPIAPIYVAALYYSETANSASGRVVVTAAALSAAGYKAGSYIQLTPGLSMNSPGVVFPANTLMMSASWKIYLIDPASAVGSKILDYDGHHGAILEPLEDNAGFHNGHALRTKSTTGLSAAVTFGTFNSLFHSVGNAYASSTGTTLTLNDVGPGSYIVFYLAIGTVLTAPTMAITNCTETIVSSLVNAAATEASCFYLAFLDGVGPAVITLTITATTITQAHFFLCPSTEFLAVP